MDTFQNKTVVVTGGASGIGRAIAVKAGSLGAKVVLGDIEEAALRASAELVRSTGARCVTARCDVSQRDDVQGLADVALAEFGAVHVVVNNAGVGFGGLSWELTTSDWEWVLGVDLWGVIHGVGVFTPLLIEAGGGHIVNTASMAGLTSTPFMSAYNVAKHGVVTLSETMFHELAMTHPEVGISVLCPGWVRTQIHRSERNRPANDRDESKATGGASTVSPDGIASIVDGLIENGIEPETVADMVIDAVLQRRFYVLTHPDWLSAVAERARRICANEDPELAVIF